MPHGVQTAICYSAKVFEDCNMPSQNFQNSLIQGSLIIYHYRTPDFCLPMNTALGTWPSILAPWGSCKENYTMDHRLQCPALLFSLHDDGWDRMGLNSSVSCQPWHEKKLLSLPWNWNPVLQRSVTYFLNSITDQPVNKFCLPLLSDPNPFHLYPFGSVQYLGDHIPRRPLIQTWTWAHVQFTNQPVTMTP